MASHDLEQETANLANQAAEARASLLPVQRKYKLPPLWKTLMVIGIILIVVLQVLGQGSTDRTIANHTTQIQELHQTVNGNHDNTHADLVSLCNEDNRIAVKLNIPQRCVITPLPKKSHHTS